MTKEEIFSSLAHNLQNALTAETYEAWQDICVEYTIRIPCRSGYVIVVWGEELKREHESIRADQTRCYSVSIHSTDHDSHADEKLLTTQSESDDFYDLKNAVYAALQQLDRIHVRGTMNGMIMPAGEPGSDCRSNKQTAVKESER